MRLPLVRGVGTHSLRPSPRRRSPRRRSLTRCSLCTAVVGTLCVAIDGTDEQEHGSCVMGTGGRPTRLTEAELLLARMFGVGFGHKYIQLHFCMCVCTYLTSLCLAETISRIQVQLSSKRQPNHLRLYRSCMHRCAAKAREVGLIVKPPPQTE